MEVPPCFTHVEGCPSNVQDAEPGVGVFPGRAVKPGYCEACTLGGSANTPLPRPHHPAEKGSLSATT